MRKIAPTMPNINFGVALPITNGPSGYFAMNTTLKDQTNANIKMLFSTRKNELRMSNVGSSLYELLFEPETEISYELIDSAIRNDMASNIPYVNILNIDTQTNGKSSMYKIVITYNLPTFNILNEQSVDFVIKK